MFKTGSHGSRSPIETSARKVLPIPFSSFQFGIGAFEMRCRCVSGALGVRLSCV